MTDANAPIFTLHRYFIWSNRMREHLEQVLVAQGPMPDYPPEQPPANKEEIEFAARQWFLPVFLYASLWLATLYVVVEGWRKLQLSDPTIDAMLDEDFVAGLRRYRNAVFHFEPTYLDKRIEQFAHDGTDGRASALHDALSKYFLRWHGLEGVDIPKDLQP